MIFRNTLKDILVSQKIPRVAQNEIPREQAGRLKLRGQFALVLTGIRRCGKSTLQAQLARDCPGFFYCNFEDPRLFGMAPEDFPAWLDILDEIAPAPAPVFLDEVQEVDGWERLVRGLLDAGRKVCVTGSNASPISAEFGRKLTGRHLSHSVWPFDYAEWLRFTRGRRGRESLLAFLDEGGFPGFLAARDELVLRELLVNVVQRDIIARHGLREHTHLTNLLLFLLASTGQPLSLQRLTKSLEIPTVRQTTQFIGFLKDAYLLFAVPKFSHSFRSRVVAPPKYYCVDNGLRRANSPQTTPDIGRRLENAVALELVRRGQAPAYAAERDAWECDFIAGGAAIQVCVEINEDNYRREVTGLTEGMKLARCKKALVLTLDTRDTISIDGQKIEVLPAWEWLGSGMVSQKS